jgi:hypothetical protein
MDGAAAGGTDCGTEDHGTCVGRLSGAFKKTQRKPHLKNHLSKFFNEAVKLPGVKIIKFYLHGYI